MKTLEFIYQETAIHFLLNPTDKNVMVNATEMAKMFDKRVDDFTRLSSTENFIEALILDLNSQNNHADVRDYSREDVISSSKKRGTYMHRLLALKFAQWLDMSFELWVIKTIEEIIFGNYQKHWEAHARQEEAKIKMQKIKKDMLINPTTELVASYFEWERELKAAQNDKVKAIKNQLKLF